MDLVAIILCIYKRWKPALVVSIIGSILMVILIPYIPFWWVSAIIYVITILLSIHGIFNHSKEKAYIKSTDPHVIEGKTVASKIMKELKSLDEQYAKGLITKETYSKESRRILKIEHLDDE